MGICRKGELEAKEKIETMPFIVQNIHNTCRVTSSCFLSKMSFFFVVRSVGRSFAENERGDFLCF